MRPNVMHGMMLIKEAHMADGCNAISKKPGRPPKDVRIPDTFENIVKAVVRPAKKSP